MWFRVYAGPVDLMRNILGSMEVLPRYITVEAHCKCTISGEGYKNLAAKRQLKSYINEITS